jgi:ABC-2 type transport system permease protein
VLRRLQSWLILNGRAARARAYVRIIGSMREPSWVLSEVLLPVLGMFAYVFVYRALGAPRAYESFAVLGGLMLAYWISVLWSMAAQFYWEKQMGNLEFYFVAPCSRISILAGMAFGGIIWTSSRALFGFALGVWVLRVPLDASRAPEAVAVFLLTLLALYALGMWLSSLFLLYGREVWHLANAFQEPVYLSSGLYFPLHALGPWFFLAFAVLPLSIGLDALRQLLLGAAAQGVWPVRVEVGILAGSLVFSVIVATISWRVMEERSKREGKLTLRWQ